MSFVIHSIQSLLCLIDECIYNVASMLYSLLIYISESNLLKQDVIEGFATRLYVLLGVFMLFKVSFSLINYIVNPDDFTNGEKGVGKLVTSVMTTLVLIVLTPRIFAEALDLQHLITGQHFFEKIIFADNYEEQLSQDMGDKIANELFGAFYSYDTDPEKNSENRDGLPDDLTPLVKNLEGTTKHIYIDLWSAFDHDSPYNAYDGIWDDRSDYTALVSTAGGIILILVLIQFCFDIAIRVIKFGFLQLIAPIPIISRMDPKSAKNGLFSRWVKQCTKTYLDLFVRLLAVYFAIYLIQIFMNTSFEVPETNGLNVMIIKAILILGTLLFAKQLPKFIEDLFGISLSKGFTLNPMRRLREVPGANRVGGALGSAYQRAVGTFQQQREMGTNRGRAILSALGGAARGVVPGAIGGRGFRGQMNATRTAMNDVNDLATKLRMRNPNLSKEEALHQARELMRNDRLRNRFGLRTSEEEDKRKQDELKIKERALEKEEEKIYKPQEENIKKNEEELKIRKNQGEKEFKEQETALKQHETQFKYDKLEEEKRIKSREADVKLREKGIQEEELKLKEGMRVKNEKMTNLKGVNDAIENLESVGMDVLHDDSKATFARMELKKKEAEIDALKKSQDEFVKSYAEAQTRLKQKKIESNELNKQQTKVDTELRKLNQDFYDADGGTYAGGDAEKQQVLNKLREQIAAKKQEKASIDDKLNSVDNEILAIKHSGIADDQPVENSNTYRNFQTKIEEKEAAKAVWEKDVGSRAIIDNSILRQQKAEWERIINDANASVDDKRKAQDQLVKVEKAIENSYYSQQKKKYTADSAKYQQEYNDLEIKFNAENAKTGLDRDETKISEYKSQMETARINKEEVDRYIDQITAEESKLQNKVLNAYKDLINENNIKNDGKDIGIDSSAMHAESDKLKAQVSDLKRELATIAETGIIDANDPSKNVHSRAEREAEQRAIDEVKRSIERQQESLNQFVAQQEESINIQREKLERARTEFNESIAQHEESIKNIKDAFEHDKEAHTKLKEANKKMQDGVARDIEVDSQAHKANESRTSEGHNNNGNGRH